MNHIGLQHYNYKHSKLASFGVPITTGIQKCYGGLGIFIYTEHMDHSVLLLAMLCTKNIEALMYATTRI